MAWTIHSRSVEERAGSIEAPHFGPIAFDDGANVDQVPDFVVTFSLKARTRPMTTISFTAEHVKAQAEDFTDTFRVYGVYFEAGFAMGLGIPVIWLCRKDDLENAHFDTRQYNHIPWESAEDLRSQLRDRIIATVGEGRRTPA